MKTVISNSPLHMPKSMLIHFDEDKTKCILFSTKILPELNITHDNNTTKQFHIVEYLRYCLDANLNGSIQSYSSFIDKMSF